ncbi:MAG: type II toxin-antitoxin system PemK/MazF family toxin [Leptolyngbyaceae cyanobacterium RM2_2_4]|nr:type II toxin-antitoxin system PemK/MazF family toxin [Leptolyngbyaceae cyanobacterium RM2_2_4]
MTDVSNYKKVTCLPIQDKGTRVGPAEVELLNSSYPLLGKDCKILCYEIYTLYEADFKRLICPLQDNDRREVQERVKRYLRLV